MGNSRSLIIGILAGLAGGLMMLASLYGGAGAFFMLFAAPVAIYIAALGWGTVPGFLAALLAAGISSINGGPESALMAALLLFLPAAWAGHLANLGQPAEDGHRMLWYPLGAIILRLGLAIAAGFVVVGFVTGLDAAQIENGISTLLAEITANSGNLNSEDTARLEESAALYAKVFPLIVPAFWLTMHVVVFYISAVIARRSGRMVRAADDIAATMVLPFPAIVWPLVGIAAMVVGSSPIFEMGAVLAGTGLVAFAYSGLAEMHVNSRGKPGRGLLLFTAYLLIFVFTIPVLIFTVMGIVRSWRVRNAPPTTS